jgi:hypothetical protein
MLSFPQAVIVGFLLLAALVVRMQQHRFRDFR